MLRSNGRIAASVAHGDNGPMAKRRIYDHELQGKKTCPGGRCTRVWGKDPFVTAGNALRGRKSVPDTLSQPTGRPPGDKPAPQNARATP